LAGFLYAAALFNVTERKLLLLVLACYIVLFAAVLFVH